MALIECPKCKRKVSEHAETCVSCGCQLPCATDMLKIKPPKTQTAKPTEKVWEFFRFFGIVIMIIGAISFILVDEPTYSPFVILVGAGIFLLARIGSWLTHG